MLIFITGKSGTGKSLFAKILSEKLNLKYISIDNISHQMLEDKEILEKIEKIFSKEIYNERGKFDRKKLGKLVFSDYNSEKTNSYAKLSWEYLNNQLKEFCNESVIIEWALLPNSNVWDKDAIKILIKADNATRLERIIERDNISKEYLENREKASLTYNDQEFDYIIYNDYNLDNFSNQAEDIYRKLINKDNMYE